LKCAFETEYPMKLILEKKVWSAGSGEGLSWVW